MPQQQQQQQRQQLHPSSSSWSSTKFVNRRQPFPSKTVSSSSLPSQQQQLSSTSTTQLSMIPLPSSSLSEAASGIVTSSIQLAMAGTSMLTSSVESIVSSPLFTYFAERVIEAAVPAIFSIIVIAFAVSQFKDAKGDMDKSEEEMEQVNTVADMYNDLYGSTKGNGITSRRMGGGGFGRGGLFQQPPLPKNLGLPKKEYIKMTSLNELYSSYDFSVRRAVTSRAQASSMYRRQSFDRALNLAMNADPGDGEGCDGSTTTAAAVGLSGKAKAQLLAAERVFLREGKTIVNEIQMAEQALAQITMDAALAKGAAKVENQVGSSNNDTTTTITTDSTVVDAEIVSSDDNATIAQGTNETTTTSSTTGMLSLKPMTGDKRKQEELLNKIMTAQKKLKELELVFIEQVIGIVGFKRGFGLRNALLGDIAVRGTGSLLSQMQDRPLSVILNAGTNDDNNGNGNNKLFVMRFPGDVQASQLNELREEVTAIVRNSNPGDEALVVLQSGGGTVTGYGLAAGQLVRLKEKGLKLTIAVEQVAASGGYMMSCVADKIIASPFAILGSIGVISEIPNFYERLKEEGIEFQTVTAGKFKRTLTPTKKVTRQDMEKSKEDIESIFQLFKGWVAQNRPQLNIDEVATGETWFGPDALERGLCDEIKTVDDVILEYVDDGYSVFEVAYEPPPDVPSGLEFLFANDDSGRPGRYLGGGGRDGPSEGSLGRKAIRWLVNSVAEEVKNVLVDSPEMGGRYSSFSTGRDASSTKNRFMARDDSSERIRVSDEEFW